MLVPKPADYLLQLPGFSQGRALAASEQSAHQSGPFLAATAQLLRRILGCSRGDPGLLETTQGRLGIL